MLVGECCYVDGLLHGLNRRFLSNDAITSIGEWRKGRIYNSAFFRSTPRSTNDEFAAGAQAAKNVK